MSTFTKLGNGSVVYEDTSGNTRGLHHALYVLPHPNSDDLIILTANARSSVFGDSLIVDWHDVTLPAGATNRNDLILALITDFFFDSSDLSGIDTRLTAIEDTYIKTTYYEEITGSSGTISPPSGLEILLGEFEAGLDALLFKIPGGSGTTPSWEYSGEVVTSFDALGNYVVSGLPTNPSALAYTGRIKLKDVSNLDLSYVIEFSAIMPDQSVNIGSDVQFNSLRTTGGITKNTTRTTGASYNVLDTDDQILGNTDANAITINLQAGIEGRQLRIVNSGTSNNDIFLDPDGAENLIGINDTLTISDGETIIITYNATDGWY